MSIPTALLIHAGWTLALPLLVLGGVLWTFGEYALHRFAMHELKGRGILSREHLEHHVAASWGFDPLILFAWLGVILVGVFGWGSIALLLAGPIAAGSIAIGWIAGYGYYEYQHAQAHLRAPHNRYTRWLRKHHFHHHFGHPMRNHGVTTHVWDIVFGTLDRPEVVKVPRRLAPAWMLEDGDLRHELVGDYALTGAVATDERLKALDRARAFASVAPLAS